MANVKVRAAKGRMVVFPLGVIASPGRHYMRLQGDEVCEVDDVHSFVRRRIVAGDLELVQETTRPAKSKPEGDER